MNHVMSTMGICLLLGAAPLPITAQDQAPPSTSPGVMATESVTARATVRDIDYKKRTVTLKGEEGKVFTIEAGEQVRNFNQIKKGDLVTLRYRESMALALRKSNEPPSASEQQALLGAPLGEKPAGARITQREVTATVENIDWDKREVTLRLPEDRTRKLRVGKDVEAFDRLQPGDQVVATYTETFEIDVTTPGK